MADIARRCTVVALLLAVAVLTAVVGHYTRHLREVARLGPRIGTTRPG